MFVASPLLASLLKALWHDVFSKAITTLIVTALTAVGTYLLWPKIAAFLKRWRSRHGLQGKLTASVDDFPHAPNIHIDLWNSSRKPVQVHAIEFMTKGQWDIPDPSRTGYVVPVASRLPADEPFIKICEREGTVARKAISMALAPHTATKIRFRLITDHSPNSAIGLFLYHLGAAVIYGNDQRLPLPDLMVSVHGSTALSLTEYAASDPFVLRREDLQNLANAALSRVTNNVICPGEILHHLRRQARVGATQ